MSASGFTHDPKQADAASYDVTATSFDELTERFSAPLAEFMLHLASLKSSDRVLDIGTGTGLVALRAGQLVSAGEVVGIDHSAGMLERAASKAAEQGLGQRVKFGAMDAEALQFDDASFGAIVSLFVLLHLPNPLAAAKEMHRVLAPGGRLVIAVGSGPPMPSLAGLIAAAERASTLVAAAAGRRLIAPDFLRRLMAEHGLNGDETHGGYHDASHVGATLHDAGFRDVRTHWIGKTLELDEEDFWAVQAVYGSAERIRLASLEPAKVAALRADFLERARRMRSRGGKLIYRYGAKFYAATRS